MKNTAIRILLVDDHDFVRLLVRNMLMAEVDMTVVGEAANGQEALAILDEAKPDLVLMDINMPVMNGLNTVKALLHRQPDLKILVVTSCRDKYLVEQFIQAGAMGFFSKVDGREEMIRAIQLVRSGHIYLSINMMGDMLPSKKRIHNPFDVLTERELQVVVLLVHGIPIKKIAGKIGAAPRTVKTHRMRTFLKLNIKNDVELTLMAYRHGLLKKK